MFLTTLQREKEKCDWNDHQLWPLDRVLTLLILSQILRLKIMAVVMYRFETYVKEKALKETRSGSYFFEKFRLAVLRKLFDKRFSYKHRNFSRVCLLIKMASKTVTRSIWWVTKSGFQNQNFCSDSLRVSEENVHLAHAEEGHWIEPWVPTQSAHTIDDLLISGP